MSLEREEVSNRVLLTVYHMLTLDLFSSTTSLTSLVFIHLLNKVLSLRDSTLMADLKKSQEHQICSIIGQLMSTPKRKGLVASPQTHAINNHSTTDSP